MKIKTGKIVYRVLMTAALFLVLLGSVLRIPLLFYIAFVAVCGMMWIALLMLRCPHCGKNLGSIVLFRNVKVCPYCRRELE